VKPDGTGPREIALEELPERNLLVLEVNLPEVEPPGRDVESLWGEIALLARGGTQ
jgi:hypothetical protein